MIKYLKLDKSIKLDILVLKWNKGLPGTIILMIFPIKLGRHNAILYKKENLGALGH